MSWALACVRSECTVRLVYLHLPNNNIHMEEV